MKLTPANHVDAMREVVAADVELLGNTNIAFVVLGTKAAPTTPATRFVRDQLPKLVEWIRQAPSTAIGVTATQSFPCSVSGTFQITVNDANNNRILDAGDGATVLANNCRDGGITTTGSFSLSVNSITGNVESPVYAADLRVLFDNLKFSEAARTATLAGTVRIVSESFAAKDFKDSLTTDNLTISGDQGGTPYTRIYSGFSTSNAYRSMAGGGFRDALIVNGTLYSTGLNRQSVQITTNGPLVSVPSGLESGQLVVTGASGSRARMSANGSFATLVELDENGDGTYETKATYPW
ncbi:MAG: hypothetical protein JWQ88_3389 [Rhodoferax sp.]|nr:hypothetical protein [Rhodoferax sp.]